MTGSHRPRIAVLTPYPPDRSGVARYTQLTLEAARRHIDIEIYTNAPRPLDLPTGLRDAGRISVTALYRNGYNSVISVVGNSHFHTSILEIMEHYGGPCILHDSRLTQIYFERLGPERFLKFASDLLGRSVAMPEVHTWLQDREVPSLFIEPILRRARPLIVHTRQYQSILLERYGVQAELSTFCPNIHFEETELKSESRLTARKRLGASADVFLIATFGYVARVKGFDTCIIATEMLRNWKIPAELYFVGSTAGLESEMRRLADVYGITPYVHWYEQFVDDQKYRDFMLAADAAIQLRTYGFGQPSAALADAISAGMAAVATQDLACACDAPEYVLTVPNRYSPLQIAEQLATIWEAHRSRQPHIEARRHYLEVHNFDYYTTRLREILELT